MELINEINRFYFEMSLGELRLMNRESSFPNLSYNSYLYLSVIDYRKDCTVSMLSELLQVTKSAVVIKVNELVRKGYVVKRQSQQDKRVHHLSLSPQIDELFRLYDSMTARIVQTIQQTYTPQQVSLFGEILHLAADHYTEN